MANYLGIDLGGTQVRVGTADDSKLLSCTAAAIDSLGSEEKVFEQICSLIDRELTSEVSAIGIGVPGLVDRKTGIVYDVINIPSWKKVALTDMLSRRYRLPICADNDANCFALGEWRYGWGRGHGDMIGLTIGTGMGAGIILNGKLYAGKNGGAGEFGMISYRDHYYEYYTSGQYFKNFHHTDGAAMAAKAQRGDQSAKAAFDEFGGHIGNAINTILYAYDVELIVLGGSISRSFDLWKEGMYRSLSEFAFGAARSALQIKISQLEQGGVLGAAALAAAGNVF